MECEFLIASFPDHCLHIPFNLCKTVIVNQIYWFIFQVSIYRTNGPMFLNSTLHSMLLLLYYICHRLAF